ncbi:MAG: hypothetical protein KGD58_16995 [Candidatus Lokiarchaeota archaeon]|nr:hypothetical protein [Candidatus Lokiarchaeota archaeon]
MNEKKLVFVYNADSDVISIVKDFWKKMLRPSSYECNLCATTFSTFGMKKDWKKFINKLDIEAEFLHRDEFEEKYDVPDAKFPSAYLKNGTSFDLLINQEEMNKVKSLDEMEALVLAKLGSAS